MVVFSTDFKSWTIAQDFEAASQYDNNTITVLFRGAFPPEYDRWLMHLEHDDKYDIVMLDPVPGGFGATLTGGQLSAAGFYSVQLEGQGSDDRSRHSNITSFNVRYSMTGDDIWPEIPTVFTDAVRKATEAQRGAEWAAAHAKDNASAAWTAANEAAGSADEARTSLSLANQAVHKAEEAAAYAEQSEDAAEAAKRDAQQAAGDAAACAGNAAEFSTAADNSAGDAADSASDAAGYAADAMDEADRAKREADRTNGEADRATSAADRAEAAAEQAGAAAAEAVQVEADRATAAEGALSAGITEEKLRNDKQDARLANLEAAAQGKLYREQVDDSEAYIKTVPAGALPYAAVTDVESVEIDGVVYNPTSVLVHGTNWLPSTTTYSSGAISSSTGERQSSSNVSTDYIYIEALRGQTITYSFTSTSTSNIGMAFFTAENASSFISGKAIKNGATVVVPSNANYARFTFRSAQSIEERMVVLGDTLPDYPILWRQPDRYPLDKFPIYVNVASGQCVSIANDKGETVPMPSSVTYAINVQEAIANE